jgi:predicted DNA-binding transcriptional regulator YafY
VTVQIVNACRARERLRFDYVKFDGEQDRREVEPYRLVHVRGRWYLVGWDVGRQDWRTFRADRVRPRVPTGPRFSPRDLPDLEAHLAKGLATAAWRFRASCRLTAGADTPEMLAVYLGMLGCGFSVDGPPELVHHLGKVADRFRDAIDTASHG